MPKSLRIIFAVHAVVGFIFGLPLLAAPGRFLGLFGWAPVDPLLSRLLGAALIALAWSSYRGYRAAERRQVVLLLEVEALFCGLACVGMTRHMWGYHWPWYVWTLLGLLTAFTVAWLWGLLRKDEG